MCHVRTELMHFLVVLKMETSPYWMMCLWHIACITLIWVSLSFSIKFAIILNYLKSQNSVISGYVQGMSDFLSPILVVLQNEVDAFWAFVGLMKKVVSNRSLYVDLLLSNFKIFIVVSTCHQPYVITVNFLSVDWLEKIIFALKIAAREFWNGPVGNKEAVDGSARSFDGCQSKAG